MAEKDRTRQQALASALRQNLKRRKAQARDLDKAVPPRDTLDQALEVLSEDTARGVKLVEASAAAGNPRALAREAVLEAMGIHRPLSWAKALDRLCQAAERGSEVAARQLLLLADDRFVDDPTSSGARDWTELRDGISIADKLRSPLATTIKSSPLLRKIEGFASRAECAWMMSVARERLARAFVTLPSTGEMAEDPIRTNRSAWFNLAATDCVIEMVRARLAQAIHIPVPCFEVPQILHYAPGQEFRPHCDYFDPDAPGYREEIALNGQRIATALIYLNDDFEGGETSFPAIGINHRGRAGDLLIFSNVDPSGRPEPGTNHAGLPPTRGEKWLFSQWIREHPPGWGPRL